MASTQLNTTTNSTSLDSTGTPQTDTSSSTGVQSGQSVQQDTSNNLLNTGQGSISLSASAPLTTVSLGGSSSVPYATTSATPLITAKHHVNWPMLSISGFLVLVAIVLFIGAGRSVKSTT
jgi:hypothetical protein